MPLLPELSVVIPTYGRDLEVRRAVQSALVQKVDLEVVVVDDGSPEPVELAFDRVRVVRLKENCGPAQARNIGVGAARAHWIAFLDSDDVWPANSLKPRLEAARAAANADDTIWSGGFLDVHANGRRRTRMPRSSESERDFASGCWTVPGSAALFSIDAWRRSGGQDPSLRRLEDYEWLLRWGLRGGRVAAFPAIVAEITRGARGDLGLVETAANTIRHKHCGLAGELRRRMESYLQLELAAARLGRRDVPGFALAMGRSLWLKPRLQPALERYWATVTLDQE